MDQEIYQQLVQYFVHGRVPVFFRDRYRDTGRSTFDELLKSTMTYKNGILWTKDGRLIPNLRDQKFKTGIWGYVLYCHLSPVIDEDGTLIHLRYQDTLYILQQLFWWPDMEKDVYWLVQGCKGCLSVTKSTDTNVQNEVKKMDLLCKGVEAVEASKDFTEEQLARQLSSPPPSSFNLRKAVISTLNDVHAFQPVLNEGRILKYYRQSFHSQPILRRRFQSWIVKKTCLNSPTSNPDLPNKRYMRTTVEWIVPTTFPGVDMLDGAEDCFLELYKSKSVHRLPEQTYLTKDHLDKITLSIDDSCFWRSLRTVVGELRSKVQLHKSSTRDIQPAPAAASAQGVSNPDVGMKVKEKELEIKDEKQLFKWAKNQIDKLPYKVTDGLPNEVLSEKVSETQRVYRQVESDLTGLVGTSELMVSPSLLLKGIPLKRKEKSIEIEDLTTTTRWGKDPSMSSASNLQQSTTEDGCVANKTPRLDITKTADPSSSVSEKTQNTAATNYEKNESHVYQDIVVEVGVHENSKFRYFGQTIRNDIDGEDNEVGWTYNRIYGFLYSLRPMKKPKNYETIAAEELCIREFQKQVWHQQKAPAQNLYPEQMKEFKMMFYNFVDKERARQPQKDILSCDILFQKACDQLKALKPIYRITPDGQNTKDDEISSALEKLNYMRHRHAALMYVVHYPITDKFKEYRDKADKCRLVSIRVRTKAYKQLCLFILYDVSSSFILNATVADETNQSAAAAEAQTKSTSIKDDPKRSPTPSGNPKIYSAGEVVSVLVIYNNGETTPRWNTLEIDPSIQALYTNFESTLKDLLKEQFSGTLAVAAAPPRKYEEEFEFIKKFTDDYNRAGYYWQEYLQELVLTHNEIFQTHFSDGRPVSPGALFDYPDKLYWMEERL